MEVKESRIIGFIVSPNKNIKLELAKEINNLEKCSQSFVSNWRNENKSGALKDSEKAAKHLENIINEILRRRDEYRKTSDPKIKALNEVLEKSVGLLYEQVSKDELDSFKRSSPGHAELPNDYDIKNLKLEKALNKLKHRSATYMNFNISEQNVHQLIIFTHESMNQPDAISVINIECFCTACREAVEAI